MPTPSPNQPPDQPPSSDFHPFPSCPEDMQNSQRNDRDPADSETSRADRSSPEPDSALDGPAPSTFEHERSQINHTNIDVTNLDRRIPFTPSSRATTASPGPQSNTTGVTSPDPSGPEHSHTPKSEGPAFDGPPQLTARTETSQCSPSTSRDMVTAEPHSHEDDETLYGPPSMGSEYSSLRTIPLAPSSFLRPGSKFHGTQQSERQVYDVQVEIKHVDMRESFLCGYLRIQGLTEDHPTLTTYFEGEIIGSKYNFYTQHEDWGANMKVDLSHWAKFSAFRPLQKHARKGPITIPDVTQKDHIFMRWKEHFLVPDHRVRTITGASFEGFYYICFNQLKGEVSGIYFHSKSEKFQQLELKHVPNRGCFSATEFR